MWCEKDDEDGAAFARQGEESPNSPFVLAVKEDAMEVSEFRVCHLLVEATELGLQRQLAEYEGIEGVSIDTISGTATVRHDPTIFSRHAVRRAIADGGYWSPECEKAEAGGKAHSASAGTLVAFVLSLFTLPLGPVASHAQSARTSTFVTHVLLGGFVPIGAVRGTFSNGYVIGAQIGMGLTPRVAAVATAFVTQTKFRAIYVNEVTVIQYDVGVEFAPGAPHESTHRVIPFVGLGAGGRTYDVRDAGTPTRTYPAAYLGVGAETRFQRLAFRMEARGYASRQSGAGGATVTSTAVAGLAGLAVHFR